MRNKKRWLQEKRKVDARLHWMLVNKVPWFQPTISPAPKDMEKGEIESLGKSLDYYAPYTNLVVLQRKYMGSYCLLCLNKDHEKSYFISRNGYLIKHVEGLNEASKDIHKFCFKHHSGMEWVFVEAELMPWRAMGSGLIDKEFGNYGYLHDTHYQFLKWSGAYDKIMKLKEQKPWERDNLKPHEKRQYEVIRDIALPDIEDYGKAIDLFDNQLELYGKEAEVHFKPFNILKMCDSVGNNYFPQEQYTKFMPPEDYVEVSVRDKDRAYDFFQKCKDEEEEGIMVKPFKQRLINIAPCLKVRTNAYLQLIYGVNFSRDFDYYLERRRIFKKLRSSVKAYEIGIQMLMTPYNKITEENDTYKNYLYKAIDAESFNKTLDTRL